MINTGFKTTNFFDETPVSKSQRTLILLVGLAYFFDLADNFNFGFIAPILGKSWGLSLTQIGQINSIFFIGMVIGGLLGGLVADRIGRRNGFIFSIFFFSTFSILNGFAPNVTIFMIARFFTGIGVASLVIIATPYLLEMLPKQTRGKWQALTVGVGCVAIPCIGILVRKAIPYGPEAWRIVYLFGGLGIFVGIYGCFRLKESPRWLVSKGRIAEAEKVFEEITGYQADFSNVKHEDDSKHWDIYFLKEIANKHNFKNSLVLLAIFAIGYPAAFIFINWAPTLFGTKGFGLEESSLLTVFISLGLVSGPFFTYLIAEKIERKHAIVLYFGAAAVLALAYASQSSQAPIYLLGFILALLLQGSNPLTLAYLGELYPTHIRSTAVGVIYSIGRLGVAIVSIIVPIINIHYGYSGVFTFMAILLILTAIITCLFGAKTSGKSLEELNEDSI